VLVAAVTRGRRHLEHRRLAVRPRRVAMEIPADVRFLDERRRVAAERQLAELGREPGKAEPAVDSLLGRRLRQRLERGDVCVRAGRANELRAEAVGPSGDELDWYPLDRDAERAALVALEHRDDRWMRDEPIKCFGR